MPADEDRPALTPPVRLWQCCSCGGTGVASLGETCPDCEGSGHS
ncbi:MAG: hypothetical protein JWO67_2488 [Streptosporangiaceae bacterium]|jgi:hypothetical protein|nr:hypothetical protein [Streptosporangiaceae bacterium]